MRWKEETPGESLLGLAGHAGDILQGLPHGESSAHRRVFVGSNGSGRAAAHPGSTRGLSSREREATPTPVASAEPGGSSEDIQTVPESRRFCWSRRGTGCSGLLPPLPSSCLPSSLGSPSLAPLCAARVSGAAAALRPPGPRWPLPLRPVRSAKPLSQWWTLLPSSPASLRQLRGRPRGPFLSWLMSLLSRHCQLPVLSPRHCHLASDPVHGACCMLCPWPGWPFGGRACFLSCCIVIGQGASHSA